MSAPRISVVVATYNRLSLITRLLQQLAAQTLPPQDFEVVVVDDGSKEPVREPLLALPMPFTLRVEVQQNAGAAAARHRGVLAARAPVVLVTDDDMQIGVDFLEKHLEKHPPGSRNVVLGRIRPDPSVQDMPLFERWYAYLNNRMAEELSVPGAQARGNHLYTGNVSFPREDYVGVGGFDKSLGQSEDVELGVRLEKAGCRFVFASDAYVLHGSDHVSFERWMKRANRYGMFDTQVARKHSDVPQLNPWRLLFETHLLTRPLLVSAIVAPDTSRVLTKTVINVARAAEKLGLDKAAFAGTSVAYGMEYLRGARTEAGGWTGIAREVARYWRGRGSKSA